MALPKERTEAPAFSVADQNGQKHTLSDYKGKWLLLYFYPRDNTPGCTVEAITIRDSFAAFKKQKCVVLGISADTEGKHRGFREKFELPFDLLADTDKIMLKAYGVWQKKKFMGKEFTGIVRTSFLIDPKGKIARVYDTVKPALHAEEVLEDLKVLQK